MEAEGGFHERKNVSKVRKTIYSAPKRSGVLLEAMRPIQEG
jgi:hypothetical protein